jgi:glutathione S-transferase
MKLYNGLSPNGARVSAFLIEKDVSIPTIDVSVLEGETRAPEFRKINSLGQVPVLELDDGTIITESVAICRYLELLHPAPALFGEGPIEQAKIEMWNRRMERHIFDTVGNVGMHEMPLFANQIEQIPEYAASLRRRFVKKLSWLDSEMADGRPFIVGDTFSVADITGMAALMVCHFIDETVPAEFKRVKEWEEKMHARPSWPVN